MQNNKIRVAEMMTKTGVAFGTSGIRGLVSNMSEQLCFYYTLAFINALGIQEGDKVAIAIDLRPSSPKIALSCFRALAFLNIKVDYCGELPTPALALYATENKIPAIMVTGSHIPFDRNGLKFYSSEGEITKAQEHLIVNVTLNECFVTSDLELPEVNCKARDLYVSRYVNFFGKKSLNNHRIAVYEHSSVASNLIIEILEILGASVISLGKSQEFVPIDTEAVNQSDIEKAKKWAKEYSFDLIISTDGDGDRPLIGTETGDWLAGDVVGLITAKYLSIDALALPISCNSSIDSKGFYQVLRTKIGSPFVIDGANQLLSKNIKTVAGFEANGGFILASNIESQNGILKSLLTRDAILPILACIYFSKQKKIKLSEIVSDLNVTKTSSNRLENVPTDISNEFIKKLSESHEKINSIFQGIVGSVQNINTIDGLRMTFEGNDVIHLRPSGNAPEFRCYTESETSQRASDLLKSALDIIRSELNMPY